ncbi:metabolite-proton symporter [Brevibacterium sanguinis]|uniref:Metabolite-proton symporter n=2 Tax=Brevibacterium TaxID=1696 RepID=A0ABX9GVR9_9MICO|nr:MULTISPECIES: MFS transporter [Brevibacterium]RBP67152.1 metabolite-proton symporter [Brevibacterium sanguinis]RBP73677.1 metabolite-proton symporter [Brevibacterium celere]
MTSTSDPQKLNYRVLLGSLSGSVIEWFDFLIYGTVAALVFNKLFFPSDSEFISTMLAFVSFSLTFFFRPLGGIIFSHIGDRIGRKRTLFLTLMLMGGGTVAIGLLPDYAAIGIAAPILLICFRILQGLGIGGEWGGALLLAYEYAPKNRRGLYGAVPQMGISLGMLLAAAVVALLTQLPDDQFMTWGWRVPFVGSIVLVFVGLWIRNGLDETPEFKRIRETGAQLKLPLKEVVTKHWGAVLVSIGSKAAETGPFYIFGTYVVAYATDVLGARDNVVLLAVAAAALVATIWMPIFGAISDRISRALLYRWSAAATIVLVVPYYLILNLGEVWSLFVATILGFGLLWGSVNAILGTVIAENFAPEVRYTGASLGYQLGAAVFGGTAPLIGAWLLEISGGQWWPIAVYVAVCAAISIVASLFIKRVAHREAPEATPELAVSRSLD